METTNVKKIKKIGFILNSNNINVYRMNKWNFHANNNIKIYDNFGDIAFQCKRKYMIVYYKMEKEENPRTNYTFVNTCNTLKRKREQEIFDNLGKGIYVNILFQIRCMNYDMTKYKQKYIQKYIDTMFLYTISQAVKYTRNNMRESLRKYIYNGADIYAENNWAFSTCAKYDKLGIIDMINQYKDNLKKNKKIVKDFPLFERLGKFGKGNTFKTRVQKLEESFNTFNDPETEKEKEKRPIKKARFELGEPELNKNSEEKLENEGFIEIPEEIPKEIPKITDSETRKDISENIPQKIPIPRIIKPKKELCGKFHLNETCIGVSPKNDKTNDDHYKRCNHCMVQHYNNALKDMVNRAKFYASCKYYSKPLINVIQENLNNPRKISYFLAINYYPLEQVDAVIDYLTKTNNTEIYKLLMENGLVKNIVK
jgi:hypothetical protein